VRIGRGHQVVGGVGDDAGIGVALRRVVRGDRPPAVAERVSALPGVEAQPCFAGIFVRAMALETVFREDGPDIAIEVDPVLRGGYPGKGEGRSQQDCRVALHCADEFTSR
jgi:hypothetical protein